MASRIRLTTVESGRYQTTVNGQRFEMVKQPRVPGQRPVWDLFRLPDEARTPVQQAGTLDALRKALEAQLPPPDEDDVRTDELIGLTTLQADLEAAADDAAFYKQATALRAIRVAMAVLRRRQDELIDQLAEQVEDAEPALFPVAP